MSGPIAVYSPNAGIAIISQPISFASAPTVNDTNYPIGQIAVVESADATFILSSKTSSNGIVSAHWTAISGGTGIQVINGDIGSVTGNPVTFTGGSSGAVFTGSGSTMTESFNFLALPLTTASGNGVIYLGGISAFQAYDATLADSNIYVGVNSGNFTNSSIDMVGIGANVLANVTSATNCTAIGYNALNQLLSGTGNVVVADFGGQSMTSGNNNTFIGEGSAANALTSSNCTLIGAQSGQAYAGAESSNIILGANIPGTLGESNTLRIGRTTTTGVGGLTRAFVQGIAGVIVGNTQIVTIDTTTGQLGSQAGSPGDITTINGDIGSVTGDVVTLTGGTSGAIFTGVGTTMTESFNFLALPTTTSTNGQIRINGTAVLHTFGPNNIYVGAGSGNFTGSAFFNVALGTQSLSSFTTCDSFVALGRAAFNGILTGNSSIGIGRDCGIGLTGSIRDVIIGDRAFNAATGSGSTNNTIVGAGSASSYNGTETSNILLGSLIAGQAAESHTCRIGSGTGTGDGQLNRTFIQGIAGVSVSNLNVVTIDTTTGQLGSQLNSPGDITTINGDVGSVTGDTVTLTGGTSGAVFTGSGATMTESFNFLSLPATTSTNGQIRINGTAILQALDTISGNTNLNVGFTASNFTNTNLRVTALGSGSLSASTVNFDTLSAGYNSLHAMQTGSLNTSLGSTCLQNLPFGTNNTAIGFACGVNMVSSSDDNIFIGSRAGQSYTGGESSNILIGSQLFGTAGESHALRIGNFTGTGQGGLNKSFIQGINGITIPNASSNIITIDTSTSQLGATPFQTGGTFTPTLAGSLTQGITAYGVQSGNYTRVGNTVWVQLYMVWTSTSATGNATIRGLPFPAGLSDLGLLPISLYQGNGVGIGANNLVWAATQLTTTVFILQFINTVTGTVTPVPITNAGAVLFQGFYYI